MLSFKPITALLILACLLAGFNSYAQQITLSYDNTPLKIVFKAIEKQSGYGFFNDQELLQKARNITIHVKDASLKEVLDLCFRDQLFSYRIYGKTITILQKESVAPNETSTLARVTITGMVTNENDEAVPGATIIAKDSSVQTMAGDDGRFTLGGADARCSIIVTSINYEPREIKPGGQHMIAVQLKRRVAELGQAVSTGYQKSYKDKITGSVVSIDNTLFNRRVSVDALDRLDGITSGLLLNKNIVAGINQSNRSIRGRSTLFANPEPLIVLDNFPYTGDVNNINPNDIENVTVLKDAAAAAIWGAFSGNGVIVLTSKKGKYNQKPVLSFNSNLTIAARPNLWYLPQLSSTDYIDVEQYLFSQGFYDNADISPQHPALSPVVDILFRNKYKVISDADAAAQINSLRSKDTRNDLRDYFYRNSVNQQYALNLSGGYNNYLYYFSAGFDKDLAGTVGSSYNRVTLTANNSVVLLNKKLELTTGIVFAASSTHTDNASGLLVQYPYLQLAGANGMALTVPEGLRQSYKDTAGQGILLDWNYRPLDEIRFSNNVSRTTDYRINAALKYTVLKGLDAGAYYQYSQGSTVQENIMGQQTYYTRDLINSYTQVSSGGITRPIPLGGIMDKGNNDYEANSIRGQLNYNRTWDADNVVTAIAGAELRSINTVLSTHRTYGYDESSKTGSSVDYQTSFPLYYAPSFSKIPNLDAGNSTTDHYISYYSNASYTWRQRYILSASARKDESNIFGVKTNQKGVPLWSLGVGWKISREKFYGAAGWLPYLRLRITDGYNGNVDRSVSAFTTMLANGQNLYGAATGAIINPPNPSLRWEKNNIINIGIDFAARNNIVSGSIEYYNRKGRDLIGYSQLDPTTGTNGIIKNNSAGMTGHGVDIILNTKNLRGALKWNSNILFSNSIDKVTSYSVTQSAITAYYNPGLFNPLPGKPLYAVYALKWAGLDTSGNPQGVLNGAASTNYSALLGSTNFNDLVYKGAVNPTFFGSLRNTFIWKQVEFSFNITWKAGYYFRRNSISYFDLFNGASTGNPDYDKRWRKAGDEKMTNVPSIPTQLFPVDASRDNFYKYSEVLVERGDHIRLQDIQLSYNLKKEQAQKLHLQMVQFYAYANNIGLLWTANSKGTDPDYISAIPNPRSVSVGVKADF